MYEVLIYYCIGSLDQDPSDRSDPCQYDSCPANSGPYGHNVTDPHLNWVNSHPVTSMRYGIDRFAPSFFDGTPDLAVSGPNVGANLGISVFFSGTVGAATYASHTAGIPALAFSGKTDSPTAWNASSTYPLFSQVYSDLATEVTSQIVQSGTPYLPKDVWLNVNFPEVSDSKCSKAEDVKFVLSRIFDHTFVSGDDVETCGNEQLPSETDVVNTDGCYASVSVGNADDKRDANATMQAVVLDKLGDLLTCLPQD